MPPWDRTTRSGQQFATLAPAHFSHARTEVEYWPVMDNGLLTYLLGLALFGLIVGALARLAIPGPNPLGCLGTMAAGVAGSFLAGIVGRLIFGRGYTAGWIASILGAAVVVYLISRYRRPPRQPYA